MTRILHASGLRLLAFVLTLSLGLSLASLTHAQTKAPGPQPAPAQSAPASEPEKKADKRVAVFIDHKGADDAGLRFALQLKERVNASSLFRLSTASNEKRVRLRIVTQEEFKDRPWIGSRYSVTWLFAENADVLSYFLDSDAGTVSPLPGANAADAAERLLARTEELAKQFAYLFE